MDELVQDIDHQSPCDVDSIANQIYGAPLLLSGYNDARTTLSDFEYMLDVGHAQYCILYDAAAQYTSLRHLLTVPKGRQKINGSLQLIQFK